MKPRLNKKVSTKRIRDQWMKILPSKNHIHMSRHYQLVNNKKWILKKLKILFKSRKTRRIRPRMTLGNCGR